MANMQTWGVAGSNVAVNQISAELQKYARARCTLISATTPVSKKGAKGGQIVQINRVGRLTQQNTTQPLGETTRTPDATIPFDTVNLTMYEYGIAVVHTDLLEQLAAYDMNAPIQDQLGRWLAETRDSLIYNQLNSTLVSYTPYGAAGSTEGLAGCWDTDGTITPTAARAINANDCVAMKNKLQDEYKAPKFPDGTYHFHTTATGIDNILRDARVQATLVGAYQGRGDSAPTVNGALVKWNGITFIEDNFAIPVSLGLTATAYPGYGFMVADGAVAEATALAPRIYLDPPSDGGRFHRAVMRGTWGVQLLWGGTAADVTAKQVRVIKCASAAS